jgi:hypothetical protein
VSAALSGLALAAFAVLAVLFLQGSIETKFLYSITVEAHKGGFAVLLAFVVPNAGLMVVCRRLNIPIRLTGKFIWKAVWVICILVFLHVFLTPARYVHPEANAWISTGRAGSWPVSAQVARRYLWNQMEWSFLIVFGGSSLLALATISVVQQTRSTERAAI